jgi:hypothetical protein
MSTKITRVIGGKMARVQTRATRLSPPAGGEEFPPMDGCDGAMYILLLMRYSKLFNESDFPNSLAASCHCSLPCSCVPGWFTSQKHAAPIVFATNFQ